MPLLECGKSGIYMQKIFQISFYFHHTDGLQMGFEEGLGIHWGIVTIRGEGGEDEDKMAESWVLLCISHSHSLVCVL